MTVPVVAPAAREELHAAFRAALPPNRLDKLVQYGVRTGNSSDTELDTLHAKMIVDLDSEWEGERLSRLRSEVKDVAKDLSPHSQKPFCSRTSGLGSGLGIVFGNWPTTEAFLEAPEQARHFGDGDSATEHVLTAQDFTREAGWDLIDICPYAFPKSQTGTGIDPIARYLSARQTAIIEDFLSVVLEAFIQRSAPIVICGQNAHVWVDRILRQRLGVEPQRVVLHHSRLAAMAGQEQLIRVPLDVADARMPSQDETAGALLFRVSHPSRYLSGPHPVADRVADDVTLELAVAVLTNFDTTHARNPNFFLVHHQGARHDAAGGLHFAMALSRAAKAEREHVEAGGETFAEVDLAVRLGDQFCSYKGYLRNNAALLPTARLTSPTRDSPALARLQTDLQRAHGLMVSRQTTTLQNNNILRANERNGEYLTPEERQTLAEREKINSRIVKKRARSPSSPSGSDSSGSVWDSEEEAEETEAECSNPATPAAASPEQPARKTARVTSPRPRWIISDSEDEGDWPPSPPKASTSRLVETAASDVKSLERLAEELTLACDSLRARLDTPEECTPEEPRRSVMVRVAKPLDGVTAALGNQLADENVDPAEVARAGSHLEPIVVAPVLRVRKASKQKPRPSRYKKMSAQQQHDHRIGVNLGLLRKKYQLGYRETRTGKSALEVKAEYDKLLDAAGRRQDEPKWWAGYVELVERSGEVTVRRWPAGDLVWEAR